MKIWVDADACPVAIKNILFKASKRTGIALTLVANQPMKTPPVPHVDLLLVPAGFDVADGEIIKKCNPGDLVITADIPLASEALKQGARVLSPRGETFTEDSIKARLTMRNFMEALREGGVQTGGPATFSAKDRENFANMLDQLLRA